MPTNMTTSMSYLWSPQAILLSRRVASLSATEECWYRRALDFSWIDEGLSVEPSEAADRIGKKCTATGAKKIIDLFFIPDRKDASKVVNEKQEILRNKLKKKLKSLSDNGKRSGQKRREKRDLTAEQMMNKSSTDDEQMRGNKDIKLNIDKKEEVREEPATQDGEAVATLTPVVRRIWRDGVELLTQDGMKEANARSLLGKLAKDFGNDNLAEAIAVTQSKNPVNAEEFLIGCLKERKKGNGQTYKSAAERSGDRAVENRQLIEEIRSGKHNEAVARIFGGDDGVNIKGHLDS